MLDNVWNSQLIKARSIYVDYQQIINIRILNKTEKLEHSDDGVASNIQDTSRHGWSSSVLQPFFVPVYYCTINLYQFGTIDAHEVREIHTTINAFSTYD